MSDTVDGPAPASFDLPNALQIGRIQLQITRLEAAKAGTSDQRKKDNYDNQIKQLEENQNVLYRQTSGKRDAPKANLRAVRLTIENEHRLLSAELNNLITPPRAKAPPPSPSTSVAPLQARVDELTKIIAAFP